jgi:hypothetical protein
VVNYPTKMPSPAQPGSWLVKTDLLHDNKQTLARRALKVFLHENLVWKAKLATGLNHAVRAGDYVVVRLPFWQQEGLTYPYGLDKRFLVTSVSFELDPGLGKWTSSFELEEAVSGMSSSEVAATTPSGSSYE